MATSWTISIGYNSGNFDTAELWAKLKASAEFWRKNPLLIADEAREGSDADIPLDGENLLDYCEVYRRDWMDGGPLHIIDEDKVLHIMASGGDPSRTIKEHVARAFCRIIIKAMHEEQIEVNLIVA